MSKQLLDTPSKHAWSLAGLADTLIHGFKEAAFKTGWQPVTRLCESAVVTLMQRITIGQLRVFTYDHIYTFPAPGSPAEQSNPRSELKAELRVVSDAFWVRLCTMGDLGFSEGYIYGEVECDDLVGLMTMFLANRENLTELESTTSYLFTLPQKLTSYRFLNTLSNSRSNISAHYDISNNMFRGFLSEDMTYSCAIFDDLDGDTRNSSGQAEASRKEWSGSMGLKKLDAPLPIAGPSNSSEPSKPATFTPPSTYSGLDSSLHRAQIRKLHHIINKARIFDGARVLEIGSGWGSLAILIAQLYPSCVVDTLTLSSQQLDYTRQLVRTLGLAERVSIHLMDYRNMPKKWQGKFDRVVSVEMIEAVGREYLAGYFERVDWAMEKKGGVGVVQVITIPEPRFDRYIAEIDFIRKWVRFRRFSPSFSLRLRFTQIFPGGFLPTLTLLLNTLTSGSQGRLIVDSVSNIGPHYARTLREWRRRFLEKFEDVIVPALIKEHPTVMGGPRGRDEIEVFKRKWIYYYCYCEVGFATRTLGDHIITFAREGCEEYGCDVYN